MSWEDFIDQQAFEYKKGKHRLYAEPIEKIVLEYFGVHVRLKTGLVLLERKNGDPLFIAIDSYHPDYFSWTMLIPDENKQGMISSGPKSDPEQIMTFLQTSKGNVYDTLSYFGAELFKYAYPSCINDDCSINWDAVYALLGAGTKGQSVHSCCGPESTDCVCSDGEQHVEVTVLGE